MIIDGKKVLYRMRNGKIVDPNIPMNGLVCYLDTRGKYNTDIYRNTLLDLSGNENHGTLTNFNFTEESGYVKGLSGGLQFDGVDDYVLIPLNNISNSEITIYIKDLDLNIRDAWNWVLCKNSSWNNATTGGFGFGVSNVADPLVFYFNGVSQPLISANAGRPIKADTIVVSIKPGIQKFYVNGQLINTMNNENGYVDNTYPTYIGRAAYYDSPGSDVKIGQVRIWNRALTDEEIQQLMEVE